MPDSIDFRVARVPDLRLPEGGNFAATFSFTGIDLTGYTATLSARRKSGRPVAWRDAVTPTSSAISFDVAPNDSDDDSVPFSAVAVGGATEYSLTVYDSGDVVLRIQGEIEWIPEVGDFDGQPVANNQFSVTVDSATPISVSLAGMTGPAGADGDGTAYYGQTGRQTNGTVSIAASGTYYPINLASTIDSANSFGMVAGTGVALQNDTGESQLFTVIGSADCRSANNQLLGLKLAVDGVVIDASDCRANTGSNNYGKLLSQWIVELDDGEEVQLYIANHSGATSIDVNRCKLVAFTAGREGPAGPTGPAGSTVASGVSYTPADGTDWEDPDPTTVAGALDALAAREAGAIADNSITNAKLADVATGTIKGRATAGTGDPEDLSAAQVRTILNVEDGATADQTGAEIKAAYESEADTNAFTDAEKSKLAGIATGANLYVHPNHSGDVTSVADGATTIANNAVTNAKAADMAEGTVKGRVTAGSGDPEDLTAAQVRTLLNVADGANAYVHPNHSGDVTSVADGATTIANDAVTNAKLANMGEATVKGRATAGTGDPEDLTASQVRTLLNVADGATANNGTVTSVDVSGGTTGLTTSGGPVTGSGTITLAGTLAAENGGTGQTSLGAVDAADFGSGAATDGYVLTADGAGGSAWEAVAGGGTVTSVAVSGTDGIQVDSGSPITGSGTIALGVDAATLRTHINVEDGADVTDTTNVTAAGALMDSEVSSLSGIKTLTVPDNTTVSTFGASLVDDTDAATARATLDVDQAGTDNSTDVTLAGTPDYLTLSGQQITLGSIDLATDVTGTLPVANGGTGQTSLASVDAAELGSAAATDGYVLTADGAGGAAWEAVAGGGGGTVTSVALSGSDGIQVDSGSPITSSGTIALGIDASALSTHLSLGDAATKNTGTTSGTVATGDHTHSAFTGDSGSGGAVGFVPAPAAGDAAAGKYLDADGTWTVPPAGGGGGDLVLLGSATASSSAQINVDNVVTADYSEYQVVWSFIAPSTDNVSLELILRDSTPANISATYKSGGFYAGVPNAGSGFSTNLTGTNGFGLGATGNAAGEYHNGHAFCSLGANNEDKYILYHIIYTTSTGLTYVSHGGGKCADSTAVAGFGLAFVSGNIASGELRVYGRKNS